MTLQDQWKHDLAALGNGGAATLSIQTEPRQLACDIITRDALAISFNTLRLSTTELAEAKGDALQRLSESLAARITYLLEPISPIEADAESCTIQLRSNPPQQDDDGRSYYELLVRQGGDLSFHRYRKEPGNARTGIASTMTREVLTRLVCDFSNALDSFVAESSR